MKIKMSDVFSLPLKSVEYQNRIEDNQGDKLLFADFHDYEKDALCEAVNNHDRLVEENDKLKTHLSNAINYIELFEASADNLGCLEYICEDTREKAFNYQEAVTLLVLLTNKGE